MSNLNICRPRPDQIRTVDLICPTCGTMRRFLREYTPWYGNVDTCLNCGDAWNMDNELMERPFCPGWRHRRVREALQRLKAVRKPVPCACTQRAAKSEKP
jgi:hypothetical protein